MRIFIRRASSFLAIALCAAVVSAADARDTAHASVDLECSVIVESRVGQRRVVEAHEMHLSIIEEGADITFTGAGLHRSLTFSVSSRGTGGAMHRFNRTDSTTWAAESRDVVGAVRLRVGVNKATKAVGIQTITSVPGQAEFITGTCERAKQKGA